jgi:plastocyanin
MTTMKSIASFVRSLALTFCAVLLVAGSLFAAAAPASAATYTVKMGSTKGLVFDPPVVTVKPGDTVEWQVGALPPHNVVFDASKVPGGKAMADKLSHKGLEGAGKTVSLVIPEGTSPGEYSYFCMPHRGAGMVGKVVVQ